MQEEIAKRIATQWPDAEVQVEVDGNSAVIQIASRHFEGLSRVKRQQAVYAFIEDYIADGSLHAVTIRASTPD